MMMCSDYKTKSLKTFINQITIRKRLIGFLTHLLNYKLPTTAYCCRWLMTCCYLATLTMGIILGIILRAFWPSSTRKLTQTRINYILNCNQHYTKHKQDKGDTSNRNCVSFVFQYAKIWWISNCIFYNKSYVKWILEDYKLFQWRMHFNFRLCSTCMCFWSRFCSYTMVCLYCKAAD